MVRLCSIQHASIPETPGAHYNGSGLLGLHWEHMLKSHWTLLLICLGALVIRLALLGFIEHPGVGDPNHYYNLGRLLADGKGFTIDYIWQYNNPPDDLVHPEDYWMPLTSVFPAVAMSLFGQMVQVALLPFVLMGSLIPLVTYAAARQFDCTETTSLLVAGASALLPEFVLNSLRTDTTVPNILLVCTSILLLTRGLRRGEIWPFVGSGLAAGLAYLVRSDSSLLLPMLGVTVLAYALWGRTTVARPARWRYALLVPLLMILLAAPWSLRNLQISGTLTTPKLDYMFYLTDFRDHWVYSTELNLQTLLASQTPAQLIGKRLFEMAASAKLLYTQLDVFLPVAVFGGLLLLLRARDREKWLTLAPALILLGGVFVFYTTLVPFKSEGGSFKKAYLTVIPLLLPLAGYALEKAVSDQRMRVGVMALAILFTGANAVELVRADARFAANYLNTMRGVAAQAQALPDTNGDGEIILMAQDPFMLRFVGVRSVMIPMENRDVILEVAQRYGVDYIMLPPDRPSLDAVYNGTETDPRFVPVYDPTGRALVFYGLDYSAGQ
ncbi:MAG: glycosyltransferase family 39 protein [Anaerolineae bacterium]|nr:glycosyltransferase family 39 protein [Anaerolineae bacterium]